MLTKVIQIFLFFQIHIKKLQDDLAIQIKKYQECKKIAQDRREKIKEKDSEIAALKNRSHEGGKENASNNIQISQLMVKYYYFKLYYILLTDYFLIIERKSPTKERKWRISTTLQPL